MEYELIATNDQSSSKDVSMERLPFLGLVQFSFKTLGRIFPRLFSKIAFRLFTTPMKKAHHKKSDPVLSKATKFEYFDGKWILKGYRWGQGQRKVLLVHGWESRGTAMRSFVEPLVKNGYEVIAFDGPAHGSSPGKTADIISFSNAIYSVIKHAGGVEHIITHSFGGAATVFALSRHKIEGINKLVMTSAPARIQNIIDDFINILKAPPPVQKHFISILEGISGRKINGMNLGQTVDRLSVGEVLIVHDEKDHIVPVEEAKHIAGFSSKIQLVVTRGFGHYKLIKNQKVVDRIVGFIG